MLLLYALTTDFGVTLAPSKFLHRGFTSESTERTVVSTPVVRWGEFSWTCNGWHSVVVLTDAFIQGLKEEKTEPCEASPKVKDELKPFASRQFFQFIFWWWKYNLMCTKKKLEWIQVTETFTSLRVCACGCICVNIYMYTCGRHTPIQWTFLKSICMLTSRADVCVKTESLPSVPCYLFCTCKRGFGTQIWWICWWCNTYDSNLFQHFELCFECDWQRCLNAKLWSGRGFKREQFLDKKEKGTLSKYIMVPSLFPFLS